MNIMKLLPILLIGIFLISFVSAETYKVETLSNFTVDCLDNGVPQPTATANLTIVKVGGNVEIDNVVMTHLNNGKFYYEGALTDLGEYEATGTCCTTSCWSESADYLVTPSGSTNILGFFILVILIIYGIAFVGFFGKNEWVAILGGMAMIGLGIFTINNGIDIFRNQITDIFSWTTIGMGAFFAIFAGIEIIQENM